MRELYRAKAKAIMERKGYSKPNRRMADPWNGWRKLTKAFPGFRGQKRQHKGSRQPILCYR